MSMMVRRPGDPALVTEADGVLFRAAGPVTLIGGAGCAPDDLRAALAIAPTLVAVDGGAATALDAGVKPSLVVGDMDSLSPGLRARLGDRVHEVSEQETTDFAKALRSVEAPLLLGVGFIGARLDHELAAMAVLASSSRRCILIGPHDVVFHAPADVTFDLAPGTRVSLFPMAPVRGSSSGLRWPIGGIDFSPGGRIGTSNEATGPVRLQMDGAGMLILLPREWLGAALSALGRDHASRSGGGAPI